MNKVEYKGVENVFFEGVSMNVTVMPRLIKAAPQPLGLYFRAGQNDHVVLGQLLAQGQRSFHGIVFDAKRVRRHSDLIKDAERCRLECILDPCTQASATVGGFSEKLAILPWCSNRPARTEDFRGPARGPRLASLAEFAVSHRFTQVLAPTHYVADTDDEWFGIDIENIGRFREALDRAGGRNVEIIYPLCMPYASFRDEDERDALIEHLRGQPIRSLWTRIAGCGSDSTATALRNYAAACEHLAGLELPVIGDQIGGLPGLSLLALSAIGGLTTGLGVGERFDAGHWHRPNDGQPFMAHPRVYLQALDLSLSPREARELFENNLKLKGQFGCHDSECCVRGITDMVEKPSRHFVVQRIRQVADLSQYPESLRSGTFLERHVRPMTDQALQLSKATGIDEMLRTRLVKHRQRLDSMRVTLGKLIESAQLQMHSRLPQTRATREQMAITQTTSRQS